MLYFLLSLLVYWNTPRLYIVSTKCFLSICTLHTVTPMSSLMIYSILSVFSVVPLPGWGMPLNLRLERWDDCSTLSASSSIIATLPSSICIFLSRSLTLSVSAVTLFVRWSSLLTSYSRYIAFFSFAATGVVSDNMIVIVS